MRVVVADAGYDAEAHHRLARAELNVRSIIPPWAGRRRRTAGDRPPRARYRRLMSRRFARRADARHYAQRVQAETVNSMIKRNLGSALRARTDARRRLEQLLRVVTHDVMIVH